MDEREQLKLVKKAVRGNPDAYGKLITDKIGLFSPADYNLSKITVYYFPVSTEEGYIEIQEKIRGEEADRLPEYLEEISIHKIEIVLD